MKKLAAGILSALLFASSLPALADGRDHRHDRRGWQERREAFRDRHEHRHHHRDRSPWAWGVAGLALGGALIAIEANRPAPPVVVAPVVIPPGPPPGRLWYYCEAYTAYYPAVQYCPGGWRLVQ